MKKFLEYLTIGNTVIGTLMMVGAVGAIEIDKWLQGGVMALLGATMFMLALYSQELYKEAK
jgi:hypothetical protein|tara:strand:+ start:92 stop:274 length:183 start_codon:yes stop_codon:yes gene_type:complete